MSENRIIKFRAWDGERLNGVGAIGWTGGDLDWVNTPKISSEASDFKIMQNTGLKDIHDVEIYEGDILKQAKDGFLMPPRFVVASIFDYYNMNTLSSVVSHTGVEVIGNIYENPDLLESK